MHQLQHAEQRFFEVFKSELCCLKDFKLEVEFKSDAQPIFCKKTSSQGHSRKPGESNEEGIGKNIWECTQFNEYSTPVVPVKNTPARTEEILR